MPTYLITIQDRYSVQADTLEQAIASYRVGFDGIEPEMFEMEPHSIIDQDAFEYLDGEVRAEEEEKD
jgi:hypothetical protein